MSERRSHTGRRMLAFAAPLLPKMALSITLGVLGHTSAVAVLTLAAILLAQLAGMPVPVDTLLLGGLLLACALLRGVLHYGEQYLGHDIAFRILATIRMRLFQALRRLAPAKLVHKESGDLVTALMEDIEIIEVFFAHTIAPVSIALVMYLLLVALFFQFVIGKGGDNPQWYHTSHWQLVMGIVITTISWLIVTYLTKPVSKETLKDFVKLTRPGGPGWKQINEELESEGVPKIEHQLPLEILCMFIGVITVYSALFATGFWIYANTLAGIITTIIAFLGTSFLFKAWGKLKTMSN